MIVKKKTYFIFACFALLLAACTNDTIRQQNVTPSTLPDEQETFNDCDAILQSIKDSALKNVTAYGFGFSSNYDVRFFAEDTLDAAMEEETMSSDFNDSFTSEEFSVTTVQEANIDEPDTVKTDGKFLYRINQSENKLQIFSVDNSYQLVTEHGLEERIWTEPSILLSDNKIILLETLNNSTSVSSDVTEWFTDRFNQITQLTVFDFDGQNLISENKWQTPGHIVDARFSDGKLRVAIQHSAPNLNFAYPKEGRDAETKALEFNKEIIENSTIEQWIPNLVQISDINEATSPLYDCTNMFVPSAEIHQMGIISLTTLNVDTSEHNAIATLGVSDTVYMSENNFYVAASVYVPFEEIDEDLERRNEQLWKTFVTRFVLTDTNASFGASRSMEGRLHNQFSFSEHENILRVVLTEEQRNANTSTILYTLDATDETLETVGSVGDMGQGEDVFSVRLIGDIGYVVTFRQIDPLYTLDLSDPTNPTVEGELKITGFSDQLFPVGDGLLLGLGQEGDENGRIFGFKAALFDVSDLTNPVVADSWIIENANSLAQWDHKAFTWMPSINTAFFPLEKWGQTYTNSLEGITINVEDKTLEPFVSIIHEPEPLEECKEIIGDSIIFADNDKELNFIEETQYWEDSLYLCDASNIDYNNCWEWETVSNLDFRPEIIEEFDDPVIVGCHPFNAYIERSIIIGEEIVSFSWESFQVHDFQGIRLF